MEEDKALINTTTKITVEIFDFNTLQKLTDISERMNRSWDELFNVAIESILKGLKGIAQSPIKLFSLELLAEVKRMKLGNLYSAFHRRKSAEKSLLKCRRGCLGTRKNFPEFFLNSSVSEQGK